MLVFNTVELVNTEQFSCFHEKGYIVFKILILEKPRSWSLNVLPTAQNVHWTEMLPSHMQTVKMSTADKPHTAAGICR